MPERSSLDYVFATPENALGGSDARLVDLVDGLLDHGVVLHGEVWLTVADIDLVYLGLSAVLTHPDKLFDDRKETA